MLSNHNTAFINELYQGFSIKLLKQKELSTLMRQNVVM